MEGNKSKRHERGVWFLVLCISGFYAFVMGAHFIPKGSAGAAIPATAAHAKTLYKTIYSHDDSASLIGFELHSFTRRYGSDVHKECSVIVRSINPSKDDYRTYCKDVVDDVVKMYGAENITINIYDSFEAYSLVVDESKLLSREEELFISNHRVAVFDAYYEEGDKYRALTYYPEAGNTLYEKLDYTPGAAL